MFWFLQCACLLVCQVCISLFSFIHSVLLLLAFVSCALWLVSLPLSHKFDSPVFPAVSTPLIILCVFIVCILPLLCCHLWFPPTLCRKVQVTSVFCFACSCPNLFVLYASNKAVIKLALTLPFTFFKENLKFTISTDESLTNEFRRVGLPSFKMTV